jgi:hypothetical protein
MHSNIVVERIDRILDANRFIDLKVRFDTKIEIELNEMSRNGETGNGV